MSEVQATFSYTLINDDTEYEVSCSNKETATVAEIPSSYADKPVTQIANDAFHIVDGYAPLKNIIIPNSIKVIGNSAFANCSSLVEPVIPDSVEEIGERAFAHCESITQLFIPDSVINIGQGACEAMVALKKVNIPNGITIINDGLFARDGNLEEIILPDTILNIGADAFKYTALKSIIIPSNVISIGTYAFQGCSQLKEITLLPNVVPTLGTAVFYSIYTGAKFYCSSKIIDDYEAATNWQPYISRFVVDDIRIWSIMYSKPINKKFDALTSKSLSQEFFDSLFPIN